MSLPSRPAAAVRASSAQGEDCDLALLSAEYGAGDDAGHQPSSSSRAARPARAAEASWETLLLEFGAEVGRNLTSVFVLAGFICAYVRLLLGRQLASWRLGAHLGATALGLAVFAIGLRRGLMPLGELVGAGLPRRSSLSFVFAAIWCLGVLCTVAEPAVGALRHIGSTTDQEKAPLLASVLHRPGLLTVAVGVGVGFAATFGALRLVRGWPMKPCLFATCLPSVALTLLCAWAGEGRRGALPEVTGLAWDCGAVTTGPVTVPIVLALGLGVARAVRTGRPGAQAAAGRTGVEKAHINSELSGFGIVTFASLYPVFSVYSLGVVLGAAGPGPASGAQVAATAWEGEGLGPFGLGPLLAGAVGSTVRAVAPLVGFLLLLQFALVREPLPRPRAVAGGLLCCLAGLLLFTLGLELALVPLGDAAGAALPEAIGRFGPAGGVGVVVGFAFLSGLVATFAEPALAALGDTVERLTAGQFKRFDLVFSVACGVGGGIAVGMLKIYFELQLWPILLVGYAVCLLLTLASDDVVCSIAWDSAGVTTGPVTVPIVLASGLSLGSARHAVEGFGILACASIGPIAGVLLTGLWKLHGGSVQGRAQASPSLELRAVRRKLDPSALA